jgi:hypothetical protein
LIDCCLVALVVVGHEEKEDIIFFFFGSCCWLDKGNKKGMPACFGNVTPLPAYLLRAASKSIGGMASL